MYGFVLFLDGASIAIGGAADALRIGPATGDAFEVVGTVRPRCLTWTERGIYACGTETDEGFTVGLSTDGGRTFEKLFSRLCLDGPLTCPDGSMVSELCPIDSSSTRVAIGADQCGTTTGGGGDATATASTSTATASASTGSGGGPGGAADPESGDACCTIAPGAPKGDRGALAAAFVAVAALMGRAWQWPRQSRRR